MERERGRVRERDRQTQRERERDRERDRQTQRERDRETETERDVPYPVTFFPIFFVETFHLHNIPGHNLLDICMFYTKNTDMSSAEFKCQTTCKRKHS